MPDLGGQPSDLSRLSILLSLGISTMRVSECLLNSKSSYSLPALYLSVYLVFNSLGWIVGRAIEHVWKETRCLCHNPGIHCTWDVCKDNPPPGMSYPGEKTLLAG